MRSIILLLLLGALISLAMDDPQRAATTLLRDIRTFIGEFGPGERDAATGPDAGSPQAEAADGSSDERFPPIEAGRREASIEPPNARPDDMDGTTAQPYRGGTTGPRADGQSQSTFPPVSPAGSAPEPPSGPIEPTVARAAALAETIDLLAGESSDGKFPEMLPAAPDSGEVTGEQLQAATTEAIRLYGEALDILWNLD